MSPARIGILGVGPRGLTVLERIVAHERACSSGHLEVFLFDPQPPGAGCHDPEQADTLLVNTVAGQLTQFSDASVVGAGPVLNGPSFYQWLQEQSQMGLLQLPAPPSPDAYYSRGLFGRYLCWVFRYLCALAPPHVKVIFKQAAVQRAHRHGAEGWVLETAESQVRVDYVFLTTGHTKPRMSRRRASLRRPRDGARQTRVIEDPYPVRSQLQGIQPGTTVAVEGMGLTAFDVLSELTVGRGGRFVSDAQGGHLQYLPSGQEPHIALLSRTGVPLSARAVNQKGVSGQYKARFLHVTWIREQQALRKLDFVDDVLPRLFADMEHVYCQAYIRERQGEAAAAAFSAAFVGAADAEARRALVVEQVPPEDVLTWEALASPVPESALGSRAAFSAWLVEYLRQDVREARKGNVHGPLKAACDVLRDLRDNLRAAIEFGGLTEASHRWVLTEFMPIMNRLAVGPPLARITELLALMEAGIVEADFGPGARCSQPPEGGLSRVAPSLWPEQEAREVQVLVKARISMHSPAKDASPLLQGLLEEGHVRLFRNGEYHPGGIEIDRHHNWIDERGRVVPNAWALGIPTEGIKFCTFIIPRTGVNSTALVDGGKAVGRMLLMVAARQDHHPATTTASELPTEAQASAFASQLGAL